MQSEMGRSKFGKMPDPTGVEILESFVQHDEANPLKGSSSAYVAGSDLKFRAALPKQLFTVAQTQAVASTRAIFQAMGCQGL